MGGTGGTSDASGGNFCNGGNDGRGSDLRLQECAQGRVRHTFIWLLHLMWIWTFDK